MKELVVVSGKGGTGKTSVAASFAALARNKVIADCDVDAADLHLVLEPTVVRREPFHAGREALVRTEACTACGVCADVCRFHAIDLVNVEGGKARYRVNPLACDGCGVCVRECPEKAIDFPVREAGAWFVSDTRHGPMVHARLGLAGENGGKLVTLVRGTAREIAERDGRDLVLIDGPPGIGCAVIASLTGASLALVVIEPTLSGIHDMKRVVELARGLRVPVALCINKWDTSPLTSSQIEARAADAGIPVVGRIRYDHDVVRAQRAGRSIVEHGDGPLADEVRAAWKAVEELLA